MNNKKSTNGTTERLKIQERALASIADTQKKQEAEFTEEIEDIQSELKALKVFLTRNSPEFKKQFPEIQRKVK